MKYGVIKRIFRFFTLSMVLAILATLFLATLSFWQYKSSTCADQLAQDRSDLQNAFYNSLAANTIMFPAILRSASTTSIASSGGILVNSNPTYQTGIDSLETMIVSSSQKVNAVGVEMLGKEKECNQYSKMIQVLLYIALALSVLSSVYSEFLKRRKEYNQI